MRSTFRSGRLPAAVGTDLADRVVTPTASEARRNRRGRGRVSSRPTHPASRTLDLGKLGRDEDLGIHEGAPAQLRSGGLAAFFKNLFSKSGDRTRLRPSDPAFDSRYSSSGAPTLASSGRIGRHAAASSLGSLQSYATNTVRSLGPLPSCLSQGSTSEVVMKKRVNPRREIDDQPIFSAEGGEERLLSRRPERFSYPNFALAEFGGRDTWTSDVFVLPHNAIRWEIMDVYTILSSMQRRWGSLCMVDVWELAEYWEVLEVFIGQYFEIEDQIVFPFMLNIAGDSADLKRYHKVSKHTRERLDVLLRQVGSALEHFNSEPASDVLPKVYKQLSEYLPKLLEYMEQQEKVMPEIFASYCESEDRALLNRAAANFIVRAANGRDGIAILTRWIEDSMVMQVWKNENLSARAQNSHKRWMSSLEMTHVDIARRFQRRMRGMPKGELGDRGRGEGRMGDRVDSDRRSGKVNGLREGGALNLYT